MAFRKALWKAEHWLRRHWLGLVAAYFLIFAATYLTLWVLIEPLGIPDTLEINLPKQRGFYHLILTLIISVHVTLLLELAFRYRTWNSYRVTYRAHIQGPGWQDYVSDGAIAGTLKENRRLEAFCVKLGRETPSGINVAYQAYVEGIGWTDWVSDGQIAGTTGVKKRLEAIRIRLSNEPVGYSILYQSYIEGCWTNLVSDGMESGNAGQGKRLEAIRIIVVKS